MGVFGLRFKTKPNINTVTFTTVPEKGTVNLKVLNDNFFVSLLTIPNNGLITLKINRFETVDFLTVPDNQQRSLVIDKYKSVNLLTLPDYKVLNFIIKSEVSGVFKLKLGVNYYDIDRNQLSLIDNTKDYNGLNITGWGSPNEERSDYKLYLYGRSVSSLKKDLAIYKEIYIDNKNGEENIKIWDENDILLEGEGLYVFSMIAADPSFVIPETTKENEIEVVKALFESNQYKEDTIIVPVIPTVYKCLFELADNNCKEEYNKLKSYLQILSFAINEKEVVKAQKVYEIIKLKYCSKCN